MQYLIILANLEYVGHAVVLDDCSIDILIRYIHIRYCNKIRSSPVNNRLARPNTHYLIDQISQDIIVIKALMHNVSGALMCEAANWSLRTRSC